MPIPTAKKKASQTADQEESNLVSALTTPKTSPDAPIATPADEGTQREAEATQGPNVSRRGRPKGMAVGPRLFNWDNRLFNIMRKEARRLATTGESETIDLSTLWTNLQEMEIDSQKPFQHLKRESFRSFYLSQRSKLEKAGHNSMEDKLYLPALVRSTTSRVDIFSLDEDEEENQDTEE